MDKNIIKKHLTQKFVNEAKDESATPGITVTNAAKKKSGEENKKGVKDMEKELGNYDKTLTKGMETTDVPNKFNYSNKEEVEYHQQMEIMNGQEMIQYDRNPIQDFKDRAKEAIVGSARMGNNPEWANVIPAQQGFTGPDFGKNLVKSIEASFEKRMDAEKGNYSFGDDIENENRAGLVMTRHSALSENKNDNNKQQIKESMKRLKFKKEFKGVGNALKMIPESYKVDNKIFEMTDGVENYKIRWEGSLTEGRAVILVASDKNLVNEDMQKMKHLMGYKSQETLGNVKGKARLDENAKFTDIWKKTKSLMESEEELEETAEVKEKADVKQAPEAKKHVQGSVSSEKGTQAPAPKTGNLEDVKKKAPEATKHVQGSASSEKGTQAPKPKTGNWDENVKGQAPEAKKHVTMKEGVTINGITFEPINENWMEEGTYEEGIKLDEYTGEQPISPEEALASMDIKKEGSLYEAEETAAAEKVADKIQDVLSPEEVNFLVQAYQQGGKEMVANALEKSVNEGLHEDSNTEPPAEGEFGMSKTEIKLRQILDKLITAGAIGSMLAVLPVAMAGAPAVAVGLGIAALAGSAFKDAAWWKKQGHHYGAQAKYGVKESVTKKNKK